jgi:hypothetical protein
MERTRITRSKRPDVGFLSRAFVAVLALPFGIGAGLAVRRGSWPDAVVLGALFITAAWAAWAGINLYAKRPGGFTNHVPRGHLHPKQKPRSSRR